MSKHDLLLNLAYSSRLVRDLSDVEMQHLVTKADDLNRKAGITGVLFRFGLNILQYLEGPHWEVASLFNRLSHDKRHAHVRVVYMGSLEQRLFKSWSCMFKGYAEDEPGAFTQLDRELRTVFQREEDIRKAILSIAGNFPRNPAE